MTSSDIIIALATLIGPIAAVQAQKWIERAREDRNNRQLVFRILMATRAVRAASSEHVQALNVIDIYFYKKRDVIEAWRLYYDFLHTRLPENFSENDARSHNQRAQELLADLLLAISRTLGYEFSKVQLMRGAYYPQGQADEGAARSAIVGGLAKIFGQGLAMPVEIKAPEDALKMQKGLQEAFLRVISGETPILVRQARDEPDSALDLSGPAGSSE